jgi:type IV pilus assembly protein PilB
MIPPTASLLKVGEIAVKKGFVKKEMIEKAIGIQKVTKEPLLKIMYDMGAITDVQVGQVLGEQWGYEYVDLLNYPVDKEILRYIDPDKARYYGFFLMKKAEGKFHVAIADPTNIETIDYLRLALGNDIVVCVATRPAIKQSIEKYYEMETALKRAEEEANISPELIEVREDVDLAKLREMGEEAPVIRIVNNFISQAIVEDASDIHVEPMETSLRIRYRVDGILHEKQSFPRSIQPGIVARLKIISNMDIAERRVPQDGRLTLKFEGRPIDFRVSSIPSIYGEKVVLRILDRTAAVKPLDQLGFSQYNLKRFENIISQPYGMILMSGPTGSGKTTTLYSCLDRLNSPSKNILTIEDPVEYQLKGINQMQVNEKAGLTFVNALRSMLRQDPNIILIGEIRDVETARIAIESALTGHLVFSTIHTNDSSSIATRLIDMSIEPFLIASSLIGATAQRLIRKVCNNCKTPYEPSRDVLENLGFKIDESVIFYKGEGCDRCSHTGYRGRMAISEILPISPDIQKMILKRVSSKELAAQAKKEGMKTLLDDAIAKAAEGLTTLEEVVRVVSTLEA